MSKNNRNVPYKTATNVINHNIGHTNTNPKTHFNSNKTNNFNGSGSNSFNGFNGSGSNSSNGFNDSNGANNHEKFKENYQNKYKETNQELIKYIYSTIDISLFKYDLLKFEHQLNKFLTDTYYVSPNFYGKNCFLVFTKIKTKYYSFLIDRRQLSYSLDKVQFDNVYIHHCNVDIDLSIYAGTIFDGVYIKRGNTFEYIITDVYYFKGTDYTGTKLKHKLYEIEIYLDNIGSHFNKEKFNNRTNLELKINKLYDVTNIRQFMEHDIKLYQDKYQIRGTCFYPEMSGTKLIYLFENTEMNNTILPNIQQNQNKKNDKSSDSDENQTNSQKSHESHEFSHKSHTFQKQSHSTNRPKVTHERRPHVTQEGLLQVTHEGLQPVTQEGLQQVTQEGLQQVTHDGMLHVTNEGRQRVTHESRPRVTHEGLLQVTNEGRPRVTHEGLLQVTNEGRPRVTHEGRPHVTHEGRSFQSHNRNEVLKKSQRPVKKVFVAKTNEQFYAILGMKTTKIADNYALFAVEQIKNSDSPIPILRKYPMDIAYISDINKTNWCRKIMTDSQKDVVFVKCVWRHDKGKWEPLELKDVKIPSLIEDIRKYLDVIEESDSESDDE